MSWRVMGVLIALAACRNDVHQAAPLVVMASATASASAAAAVSDDMPALGTDQAAAERALVAAGWTIGHRMSGTGGFVERPGTAPVERDTSSLNATRAGSTLNATFDWSRLVRVTRTSPPLADETSVKAVLADFDKRLGARTWSQSNFGPDRDLAMWQSPTRVARVSVRHDATGWILMESWAAQ